MNVDAVMTELATALDGIDGLRVHDYRAPSVHPPAMLVPLPVITYDETYGRGMDRHDYDLVLLLGAWPARTSVKTVGPYATGTGARSVKAVLEGRSWSSCQVVVVDRCEFANVTVAGNEYLGAVFPTVIYGTGS